MFYNSVDLDQLASCEKLADQDLHCFPLCMCIHSNNRNPAS